MQATKSFSAKVSYMGETKRMTNLKSFEELMARTSDSFSDLPSTAFKFFYTDSENDLISVSGQQDLDEAPLFYFSADGKKTASVIKLIVADNSQSALDQIADNGVLLTEEQSAFAEEQSAFTIIDTCETERTNQPASNLMMYEEEKKSDMVDEMLKIEKELLKEAEKQGHDQNVAVALYHVPEYEVQVLSEPERELVYDTLAKDQDERMALALQKAEYNGVQESDDKEVEFTGVCGPVDFDLDLQIAREMQMKDWQEEEKKKKAPEEEEAGKGEGEEVVEIEGVDMDALRKFITKEVEGFFAQKLSEVLKSAQPA